MFPHRISSAFRPRRAAPGRRQLGQSATACCAVAAIGPFALGYVVQPGDTVSGIADKHDTTVARIVDANDLDSGGDLIYAGDVLRVPAAHGRAPKRSRSSDATTLGARRVVVHTVRPGDTVSALAVRYHAWTDEVVAANGGSEQIFVGQRLRIPVVVRAAAVRPAPGRPADDGGRSSTSRLERALAERADPSRAHVRRIITATANRHGVDPQLALAVSWQEAGWQQHHVSRADAIGAMQVIPSTGVWISDMIGRDLDLLRVRDNVTAGVVLLGYLTDVAPTRIAVAGYYQGLAGVRERGMYDDTKRYVANVMALKGAFERGDYPG